VPKDPIQVPCTGVREFCDWGDAEGFAWGFTVADFSFGVCDRLLCFGLGLAASVA
jgi:hypothetical protein